MILKGDGPDDLEPFLATSDTPFIRKVMKELVESLEDNADRGKTGHSLRLIPSNVRASDDQGKEP